MAGNSILTPPTLATVMTPKALFDWLYQVYMKLQGSELSLEDVENIYAMLASNEQDEAASRRIEELRQLVLMLAPGPDVSEITRRLDDLEHRIALNE